MSATVLTSEEARKEIDSWKRIYDVERAELERSDRVLQQLEAVRQGLILRCSDLEAETARLSAEARDEAAKDEACLALEVEIRNAGKACEELQQQEAQLLSETASARLLTEEFEDEAAAALLATEEEEAAAEAHEAHCRAEEASCEEASRQARSMVTEDALSRAAEEAEQLQGRLEEQEVETARLRQALIDSWAARSDDDPARGEAARDGGELENLDNVEEELRWLADAQQRAAAEVHHIQRLERSEAALQARLRGLAEEKASLQSVRVDLGDAGTAMREAVKVQSEEYVRRVGALEDQRRDVEEDRKKLMQECADMQARVDAVIPELVEVEAVEERQRELEGHVTQLSDESQRLRDINAAFGELLLGDAGGSADVKAAGIGQELTQVVNLLRRAVERADAQELEKERLADRIRMLEREAAQPGSAVTPSREVQPPPSRGSTQQAPAPPGILGSGLASATSVLRGGLGRLRDAALDAL